MAPWTSLRNPRSICFAGLLWTLVVAISCAEGAPRQGQLDKMKQDWDGKKIAVKTVRVLYRAKYDDPEFPAGSFLRIEVVARADGSYFHDSSKGSDQVPWEQYRSRQVAFVTPTSVKNFYPFERSYFEREIKADDPLPGSHRDSFFFLATGLWPFESREPPRGADDVPLMPHEIFQEPDKLKLLPDLTKAHDRLCHVVCVGDRNRLYVDLERNSSIVKREFLNPENGKVQQALVLLDQRELLPGVWLPQVILNRKYRDGELVQDSRLEIQTCKLNQPEPDSVFVFGGVAGLVQRNVNNKYEFPKQVLPGGREHLDNLVDWLGHEPLANDIKRRDRHRQVWKWGLIGLLGAVVLGNELRRSLRTPEVPDETLTK